MARERDYAYEALAEVTASDPEVARGQLNAALRDIRAMESILGSLTNSYLLGDEIHLRAQMYRVVFSDVPLTPNALAKHWLRVKEESTKKRPGANLHAPDPEPTYSPVARERNLAEARKILAMFEKEEG